MTNGFLQWICQSMFGALDVADLSMWMHMSAVLFDFGAPNKCRNRLD
jgi:hypothetical protein